MTPNDLLIDLLEDNRRRLHRLLSSISEEIFFWQPEAEANNMAITIWHMARIFDVFLTRQALGHSAQEECWFKHGWAAKTRYDPRGIGQNGWGMLTGYTQAEVAAMPHLTREQILGYLNDVYDTVCAFLTSTSAEELFLPSAGFDGRYSKYQCVQMALLDNVRHLGELFAIQASWERRHR